MLHPRVMFEGSIESCAKYVGIAKKWARQTYDAGILRRTYRLGEATIRIENLIPVNAVGSGISKVWIKAGGEGGYQFIGSLARLYKDYLDPNPGFPGGRYFPRGYSVNVTNNDQLRVKALGSSAEAPPTVGDWVYDPMPENTDQYLVFSPAHQTDGAGIRSHFRDWSKRKEYAVPRSASMWASSHPCHAYGIHSSAFAGYSYYSTDVYYDFPPLVYTNNRGSRAAPPADYFRAAVLQDVVVSGGGKRTFVVMADVSSNFTAFPLAAVGEYYTFDNITGPFNVPADQCITVACPFPTWVTHEPVGKIPKTAGIDTHPLLQLNWKFNPDGTKAACIAAHQDAPFQDVEYVSTLYDHTGAFYAEPKEDYTGMMEVELLIVADAVGDGFSFEVNLLQDIYSKRDLRHPVAVGYAMAPMQSTETPAVPIPTGSLLILEYDHYWSSWKSEITSYTPPRYWLSSRPVRATVAKITMDGTPVRKWLAYYAVHAGNFRLAPVHPTTTSHPFYPLLHEFPELGIAAEETENDSRFVYATHLHDIDLEACAVCIGTSITTIGVKEDQTTYERTWYVGEAAALTVIAFNKMQKREIVGHPLLKTVLVDMLHMAPGSYPHLGDMEPFYAATTVSLVPSSVPSPGFPTIGLSSDFYTMSVQHGTLPATEYLVTFTPTQVYSSDAGLGEGLISPNIGNCGLFPDMGGGVLVWTPPFYPWADGSVYVRPGMRWATFPTPIGLGDAVVTGDYAVTDFPIGAIWHNRVSGITLAPMANLYTRFSVHPNGSWAIFCGPIAAHETLYVAYNYESGGYYPNYANFAQTVLDCIVFESSKGRTETTHIASLNKAFSKTLTPADYYFTFRENIVYGPTGGGIPYFGYIFPNSLIEVQPQSNDFAPSPWFTTSPYTPIALGWMAEHMVPAGIDADDTVYNPYFHAVNSGSYQTYSSFLTFPTPRMEGVFYTAD